MKHRGDDIRKRIAKDLKKRKANSHRGKSTKLDTSDWTAAVEDKEASLSKQDDPGTTFKHPLFTNAFLFKCLISASLILIAAITYRTDDSPLDSLKPYFSRAFTEEFQFAAVNRWYTSTFGNPLAFLMNDPEETNDPVEVNQELSIPAAGKIQESFKDNGEGVKIETASKEIKSIKEGYIIDISKDPDSGLTVVIQHADNSYSSYGELKEVNVSLYQYVDKGSAIGSIQLNEQNKGVYFFAIKQGENYIDPIQVISFE